jgi:hypothetical protein
MSSSRVSLSLARRLTAAALGAALGAGALAACGLPRQTRRPGSDMVIVKRSLNPVEAVLRTQCQRLPAGGPPVVGDSVGARQSCPLAMGDSAVVEPGKPQVKTMPPQRVP